jgi:stearoyl-CoA desaturase (delta-9 desaturase)
LGLVLTGTTTGAWHAFLWAGLARIFLIQHVTWAVNSACHMFGTQPAQTGNGSRNHTFLALLTLGEGWHNNHHSQPSAAIHGFRPGEFDLSGAAIRLLEWAQLIWRVRRATEIHSTSLLNLPSEHRGRTNQPAELKDDV